MSVLEPILPTLVAGAVVVFFALRAVRAANRADQEHRQDIARRRTELEHWVAQLHQQAAAFGDTPEHPAALRVALELTDRESVPDVELATRSFGPLIEQLRGMDTPIEGRGMAVTGITADPGVVELTFSLPDATDAPARLERVAARINGGPVRAGYALPPGVASARAVSW